MKTLHDGTRFELYQTNSTYTGSRPYVIFDKQLQVKLVGFWNYRSAYANFKRLEKDPSYRGY